MTRVFIAGIVAGLISILAGPRFIDFLRRKELGQQIREEGPARHVIKQGTPTAGGILILIAASIAFFAFSKYELTGLTVFFVTLGCGAIGFLDDFIKFTHKRSLGLSGRWKLLLLACVAARHGLPRAPRRAQPPDVGAHPRHGLPAAARAFLVRLHLPRDRRRRRTA